MYSWREKANLAVPLGLAVLIFYFCTLHSNFFSALPMPDTVVDRAIPFLPVFVVPYFSYYLLLLMPIVVIHEPQEFRDTAFGFALIVFVSCTAFFFWPTAITTSYSHPLIRGLLAVDRPRNACPSLHASLSLFCALCARRSLRSARARYALGIWAFLVIASTLLTKRHSTVDIAAGMIFGWIVYRLLFERSHPEAGDSEALVKGLEIRERIIGKPDGAGENSVGAAGRRFRAFAFPIALLAIAVSTSAWAIAHSSVPMLVGGAAASALSFYLLLRLMHEAIHGHLLADRFGNWIVTALLGFTFLASFTAFRVMHRRLLRSPDDPHDANENRADSSSSPSARVLHAVRLIWILFLNFILLPVSALRFGSANQRKLICSEYALLFLVGSILLRSFSVRNLLVVWILPVVLAGLFAAVRGIGQFALKGDPDRRLAAKIG
ncbi:MAG: phosphatase PAP2 family protein [Terracidiphilus sp.]|nr:phosphatase PAP2 family protein [Terracidiphilus sp.]